MTNHVDLGTYAMPERKPVATALVADIIVLAADIFAVTREQIVGSRGRGDVILARQAAFIVAREAGHSYTLIATANNRDHATVHYGAKKAVQRSWTDPEFAERLDELRRRTKERGRRPIHIRNGLVIARHAPVEAEPPAPEPEPEHDDLDDVELLSRAVAAHFAREAA